MIELHQFRLVDGVNLSPFCAKVEFYLRLRRLPHRVVEGAPTGAPKGKLPYVVIDGRTIADSADIVAHLEAAGPGLDDGLDAAARARAHVIVRTLEESLYFAMVHDRWSVEANWPRVRDGLLGGLPAPIRPLVAGLVRRKVRRDLAGQGYGRHSVEEVRRRGIADIDAIADLLGAGPFVLDDRPRVVDVVLHAFVDNLIAGGFPGPLTQAVAARPELVAHHARMAAAIGPRPRGATDGG